MKLMKIKKDREWSISVSIRAVNLSDEEESKY